MLLLAGLTTRWFSREAVDNVLLWTGDISFLDGMQVTYGRI
jgi:hypothetical protein